MSSTEDGMSSTEEGVSSVPHLCFGTYRLNGLVLKDAADQAVNAFRKRGRPQLIDGAFKYQNLDTLIEILNKYPLAKLGYKVEYGRKDVIVEKQLEGLKAKLPDSNRIFRILLHNYVGKKSYLRFQEIVEDMFGEKMAIGVCNISEEELKDLVEGETPARVNFVQNEFHPFLETNVPAACKKLGIWFEAHSTLTGIDHYRTVMEKTNTSDHNKYAAILSNPTLKMAQLAVGFAAEYSDSVCFSSQNYVHLMEILNTPTLDQNTLSLMNNLKNFHPRITRYKGTSSKICSGNVLDKLAQFQTDQLDEAFEFARNELVPDLLEAFSIYFKGGIPANKILYSLEGLPKWYRKPSPGYLHPHDILAQLLYIEPHKEGSPDCTMTALFNHKPVSTFENIESTEKRALEKLASANQKLDQTLKKVRHRIVLSEKESLAEAKVAPDQETAVERPSALPVDSYPPASEFEGLLQFLRTGGIQDDFTVRFQHGTVNADGRLDLCKQGIKNAFVESCEAVEDDGNNGNTRFQHGTLNSDGRLDLCKQGIKEAFIESCEAVEEDGNQSNTRFQHGTLNSDGRLDLCKQGIKKAFIESCEVVEEDGDQPNTRFQHGTLNSDGRLDLCKQGIKNAFVESCKVVEEDGDQPNTRFQHGTLNSDGRLDLCKQGIKNAFVESCKVVEEDGDQSNTRFQHGTLNSDGRLDLCKQGIKKAFIESCEAVEEDGNKSNTRFQRGTLNSDGCLDLCKQGIKNAFLESCEVVAGDANQAISPSKEPIKHAAPISPNGKVPNHPIRKKPLIKHYLFGNNRIAENEDGFAPERMTALCSMIRRRPDIETWFLAGNEFGPDEIKQVAEAMDEIHAKYLWFKMNPLKTGAYHLGKLVMINPNVELLDLMNCGLCNDGIKAFLQGLRDGFRERNRQLDMEAGIQAEVEENILENFSNLKHLYIDINGIDDNACLDLGEIFELLGDKLESLFINVNRIGDKGIEDLFGVSKISSTKPLFPRLQRISLGSLGLGDASLLVLIPFIRTACPSLVSLDFSSYKSTVYFGEEHNKFTAQAFDSLLAIGRLLKRNAIKAQKPDLTYLGFQHCFGDHKNKDFVNSEDADDFVVFVNKLTELGVSVNAIQVKTHDMTSVEVAPGGALLRNPRISARELKAVNHPVPAVDYIDSIYRNTMK